ncbi:hypothetical protein Tco_0226382 [Tanacetum coccineum]
MIGIAAIKLLILLLFAKGTVNVESSAVESPVVDDYVVSFIRVISDWLANTAYGFFLGKRVGLPVSHRALRLGGAVADINEDGFCVLSKPLNENEGEHSQGQTTADSEGVKSANIEDAQDIDNSKGGESLTHPQEDDHQNIVDTQPV